MNFRPMALKIRRPVIGNVFDRNNPTIVPRRDSSPVREKPPHIMPPSLSQMVKRWLGDLYSSPLVEQGGGPADGKRLGMRRVQWDKWQNAVQLAFGQSDAHVHYPKVVAFFISTLITSGSGVQEFALLAERLCDAGNPRRIAAAGALDEIEAALKTLRVRDSELARTLVFSAQNCVRYVYYTGAMFRFRKPLAPGRPLSDALLLTAGSLFDPMPDARAPDRVVVFELAHTEEAWCPVNPDYDPTIDTGVLNLYNA